MQILVLIIKPNHAQASDHPSHTSNFSISNFMHVWLAQFHSFIYLFSYFLIRSSFPDHHHLLCLTWLDKGLQFSQSTFNGEYNHGSIISPIITETLYNLPGDNYFNPTALSMAKPPWKLGHSECNSVKRLMHH